MSLPNNKWSRMVMLMAMIVDGIQYVEKKTVSQIGKSDHKLL